MNPSFVESLSPIYHCPYVLCPSTPTPLVRFCAIASGAVTYYENQNDMFDENRDSKGEIALANILVVETSADPQVGDEVTGT